MWPLIECFTMLRMAMANENVRAIFFENAYNGLKCMQNKFKMILSILKLT